MQLRVPLSFFRPEDRFQKARHSGCPVFLVKLEEAGQAKDFAVSDILKAVDEYFLETLLGWNPASLGRMFIRSRQLSYVACVAGVKIKGEEEGGIWAREGERKRKESSPLPPSSGVVCALIPFPLPFERLPRRLKIIKRAIPRLFERLFLISWENNT